MSIIRAFIAVEIPEELKKELVGIQEPLKQSEASIKWTDCAQLHATLKFLGNISEDLIFPISKNIENILKDETTFSATIQNIFALPHITHPRVICAGITEYDNRFSQLADRIENALVQFGIQKEKRKFTPHITLGRVKESKDKQKLIDIIKNTNYRSKSSFSINAVNLFKSTLTETGAIHALLRSFCLF